MNSTLFPTFTLKQYLKVLHSNTKSIMEGISTILRYVHEIKISSKSNITQCFQTSIFTCCNMKLRPLLKHTKYSIMLDTSLLNAVCCVWRSLS